MPQTLKFLSTVVSYQIDNNTISTDANCVDRVQEQLDSGKRSCPCNVDCNETNYEASLSSATWPAKGFEVNQTFLNCTFRVLV